MMQILGPSCAPVYMALYENSWKAESILQLVLAEAAAEKAREMCSQNEKKKKKN